MSEDVKSKEWYQLCSGKNADDDDFIEQGDFLNDLPIITWKPDLDIAISAFMKSIEEDQDVNDDKEDKNKLVIPYDVDVYNVIVMTQSCDFRGLKEHKDKTVTLCVRTDFNKLYKDWGRSKQVDKWNSLVRGQTSTSHMLKSCSLGHHVFDYQVVDFSNILTVSYAYLEEFVLRQKERIRLISPYKEQLSQAFAKSFMRVGLPSDLPRKFPY